VEVVPVPDRYPTEDTEAAAREPVDHDIDLRRAKPARRGRDDVVMLATIAVGGASGAAAKYEVPDRTELAHACGGIFQSTLADLLGPNVTHAYRYWRTAKARWMCVDCGRQTTVTAGTIFHRTRTPSVDLVRSCLVHHQSEERRLGARPAAGPGVWLL
jgi:hypothetical protein